MSLPRYPAYKDSGVSWLGEVPAHWELGRMDRHSSTHRQTVTPDELADLLVLHYSIPSVQSYGTGRVEEGMAIDSNKLLINCAQLLVSKLNPHKQVMVIAVPHDELLTVASSEFVPLIPKTAVVDFVKYVWQSSICLHYLLARCDSATRSHQRVSPDDISKMLWVWPALEEQIAITSFLDRETAKIDALIAEQEKLIALLAEKRQATISRAVTRGLDPNVPLKDSGVPWLGKVPAHWEVCKIKHQVLSIEQGWSPQCENFPVESSDEWGVLKVGCVNGGIFNAQENKKLPAELNPLPEYSLRKGDLLISRANTRELVGSAAVVHHDFPHLMLCDKLYRLRIRPSQVMPDFISLYLGTKETRSQIELEATGASSSMLNIGQSVILELLMPLPSLEEQSFITSFITAEVQRFNQLLAESTHAISLLKERRAALISAAVTGKIDVRALAA